MQQEILDTAQEVFDKVSRELYRQYGKWGRQFHDVNVWNTITLEEYGELAKAINEAYFFDGKFDPEHSENVETEIEHQRLWHEAKKELTETIACLIQTYIEIDRCLDYNHTTKESYGNG